ncbi:MAG: bifunctional 5,10-methylenetetrahydrofolate dehydrogenase/5,10-methenyltetrahydrofolate cyclohydrolase [Candidatus Abawacabacteria bacterium]|nr:bifunctional 5,10-methylenetetrahydrofolate dehydrogenase/5,10-methenyltetrahydrofolate cyclohydrolase [Candidatus Abawacabacteria bacterium]
MSAQIIDGKKLAQELKDQLRSASPHGGLGVVLIGENPASLIYIKQKEKLAQELSIPFELLHIREWKDIEELKEKVLHFGNQEKLAGVIVQMPLPERLPVEEFLDCIPIEKDVDGLKRASPFIPATARGVMYALKSTKQLLTGKHAVIIGRSKLVGRPLIDLLLAENCTVTIAHSYTQDLPFITQSADILIAAVGKAGLINGDMVKDSVIAIDVGINRQADKIVGDISFTEVSEKASFITPVPGGIGPLTVAFLMANVLHQ